MTHRCLDLAGLRQALTSDPEFTLQTRHLTVAIRVVIEGEQSFTIIVCDGAVIEIDGVVTVFDSFDVKLEGTREHWDKLLAIHPPAFYQDFMPAMLHHGFRIEGNMETIMAYYPAIRRLGDLLRALANGDAP
jgi:hypothetical protein